MEAARRKVDRHVPKERTARIAHRHIGERNCGRFSHGAMLLPETEVLCNDALSSLEEVVRQCSG